MVLAFAAVAKANTVELPLNCAETYDINTPYRTIDFDLGVTFSEVSHVYIDWSGKITAGLAIHYTDPCNPFPLRVGIYAAFYPPFRYAEAWGGEQTYPAPEPFDSLSEIKPSTWSDLLDGQGNIVVQYEELWLPLGLDGGVYIEHGSVMLDNAILIVDGTIIPEPATFFLLALGCFLLKRARK